MSVPALTGSINDGDADAIKTSFAPLILKSENAHIPFVVHKSIGWNPDNPVGTEIVVLNEPDVSAVVPVGTGIFLPPNIISEIGAEGGKPVADKVTAVPVAPAAGFTYKSAMVNALNASFP